MDTQAAWRTASHQGSRDVNADAVAAAGGIVALADGIGDDLTAAHAALQAATAAVGVPAVAGPTAALEAARKAVATGDCVLVVAQPFGGGYRIGWVGDVRAYAWDGVNLRRLTRDHTLAQYFRDHGEEVTPRMEHLVTTSVHTATASRYGTTETSAASLVLTTDGVHRTLSDEAMATILRHASNPAEALVQAADAAGTRDNATVVVLTGAPSPANPMPTRPLPMAA
ncbi:serine/threonine protein phosphatase [Actinophytocola sp.]|uniref:PP2C family protein-serine/threonine phosphatase n=1 Tax=Actinophytocola sp. TaxID=1872138 RepID=UPI002D321A6A|nr:serine/threonine protein phosphatase [Actinophytocola sp.]HYQ64519.1 serine/threonine protein phosphatase [Actinophytocola sp.]